MDPWGLGKRLQIRNAARQNDRIQPGEQRRLQATSGKGNADWGLGGSVQ